MFASLKPTFLATNTITNTSLVAQSNAQFDVPSFLMRHYNLMVLFSSVMSSSSYKISLSISRFSDMSWK